MSAAPTRSSNAPAIPRISVVIANRQRVRAVDSRLLRQIVRTLLSELPHVIHTSLDIHLVTTLEMTRLNESFLHHAGSTDVITFDYEDDANSRTSDSRLEAHAEIFVCMDEAVAQAGRFRTTWQSELVRYIIHGVLHLIGLDDRRAANRRKMKREENRLLRNLRLRFPTNQLASPARRGELKP